jgi:hypothetical protein
MSTDVYYTIGYYLLVGLAAGGRVAIGCNYLSDFVPESYQNFAMTATNVADALIIIIHTIYYSFVRNWANLHIYGFIASVLIIDMVSILPESPKFLYTKGRYDEARAVLDYIAMTNGEPKPIILFDAEVPVKDLQEKSPDQRTHLIPKEGKKLKGSITEMLSIWQVQRNFWAMMILISSSSFCFFLITYQMKNMKGSIIYNNMSQGIACVIANILSGIIYYLLGPKLGFNLSYLTAAIGCSCLLLIGDDSYLKLVFIFVS